MFLLGIIQLYLIWFGDQEIDENETSIGGSLGEVALRSGGEILRVTEESLGNGEMGLVSEIPLCVQHSHFARAPTFIVEKNKIALLIHFCR